MAGLLGVWVKPESCFATFRVLFSDKSNAYRDEQWSKMILMSCAVTKIIVMNYEMKPEVQCLTFNF